MCAINTGTKVYSKVDLIAVIITQGLLHQALLCLKALMEHKVRENILTLFPLIF